LLKDVAFARILDHIRAWNIIRLYHRTDMTIMAMGSTRFSASCKYCL